MKEGANTHESLQEMMTNRNLSVAALSMDRKVLLIFLRNFGCTFCRQALSDIQKLRHQLDQHRATVVLVHFNEPEIAQHYLQKYKLEDVDIVYDKEQLFYASFGLVKGKFTQLFGLQNWIKGFQASTIEGHGLRMPIGDGLQMPGVFVISKGEIQNQFIHKNASDRPNYLELIRKVEHPKPVSPMSGHMAKS